jgi:hypothetical protein
MRISTTVSVCHILCKIYNLATGDATWTDTAVAQEPIYLLTIIRQRSAVLSGSQSSVATDLACKTTLCMEYRHTGLVVGGICF